MLSIKLSEEENNNYGVIISHSKTYPGSTFNPEDEYVKDEITKNGIQYIFNNLIEPLQTNMKSKFQYVKSRETLVKKSRGKQVKSDIELFKKMQKTSDKDKYNLYALKMNDFNELLRGLNNANKSSFFIKLLQQEKYLIKMFDFLKYINEKGIYYYQSTAFYKDRYKIIITELRKIYYKYFIIISDRYYHIDFNEDLKDFETFQTKMKTINFENLRVCVLTKTAFSASSLRTAIINYKPILPIKNKK
jgi:hypothetical protein